LTATGKTITGIRNFLFFLIDVVCVLFLEFPGMNLFFFVELITIN